MELIPQSVATRNWCDNIPDTPFTLQHHNTYLAHYPLISSSSATLTQLYISTFTKLVRNYLSRIPMSSLHPSLLAILLSASLPLSLPLSVSYYLSTLVSCSTPPTPPTTTNLKIYSHFEEFDTLPLSSQFHGIFCRSRCLVVYCEWWEVGVGVLLFLLGWSWPSTLTGLLTKPLRVKNGRSNIFSTFHMKIEV